MQKRTREIIAVLLLGVLLLVGAGAMGYYILIGHNWNVAASHIDDSIGKMDGYTVLLYAGTRQPVEDGESKEGTAAKKSAEGASASSDEAGGAHGEPSGQDAAADQGGRDAPVNPRRVQVSRGL